MYLVDEKGLDVTEKAKNKKTALHLAAGSGMTQVVEFLIYNGADVNAIDEDQNTLLAWAKMLDYEQEYEEKVEKLIKKGPYKLKLMVSGYVREIEETMEEESSNFSDQTRDIYPIVLRFYVDDIPQKKEEAKGSL